MSLVPLCCVACKIHFAYFSLFSSIGVFTGLVVTHVLFGLISSSVNAVIVLFAGSPVEFEKNHPELGEELRSAWREVWPGCMDIVDIRVAQIHSHANETVPLV